MAADAHGFEDFVRTHSAQLNACGIPQRYWRSLHTKLKDEIYDAGNYFSMCQDEDDLSWHIYVVAEDGLKMDDPDGIFLVDHAWMYDLQHARKQLEVTMDLAERMCQLMGCLDGYDIEEISQQGFERSKLIDLVFEKMWKYNQSYQLQKMTLQNDEIVDVENDIASRETVWFVMDEFGSKFNHSDDCNLAFKIFFHIPTKLTYSVFYPIKDIGYQEEATRDYIPDVEGELRRKARLYPWFPGDLDLDSIEDNWILDRKNNSDKTRCDEKVVMSAVDRPHPSRRDTYKVFSDSDEMNYLTLPNFTLVDNEDDADILWPMSHFKDFESLARTPDIFINQFPYEYNITCKDLLAETAQRYVTMTGEDISPEIMENRGPLWMPATFNLNTELPQFIKHFKDREQRGQDNVWMCKPWNLGRGLGHVVANNLNQIIRQAETGPKIVQKYIDDPILFTREGIGGVKFDYRYLFLLKSTKPLVLYAYEYFFPRVANHAFALDDFEDYEKHFTVFNYVPAGRKVIRGEDFAKMFDEQYPKYLWDSVEKQTFQVAKELFYSAANAPPPTGIAHNPQSRALYGIDFMVKWSDQDHTKMQVMVCEVNFCCDNKRMCEYYPTSVDDIFETLFLDREGDHVIRL